MDDWIKNATIMYIHWITRYGRVKKMMTIEMRMAHGNFIEVAEMTTEKQLAARLSSRFIDHSRVMITFR